MAYVWDPERGEYRDAETDKVLSEDELRAAGEVAIAALVVLLMGLTQDLRDDKLTVPAWRSAVSAQLVAAHIAVGSLTAGGLAHLTPATTALLDAAIKVQLTYLDAWALELAASSEPLTQAALVRAGLYGQAVRGTFQAGMGQAATLKGMTEERNELGASDHCDGCRAATRAGWVKIGVLPPVGQRDCLARCHCVIVYRAKSEAAQESERLAVVA